MPSDTTNVAPASDGREIDIITKDGEIVSGLPAGYENGATSSLAVSLARAEVDQQVATAKAMPRSISRAVQNIITLATLDDESAAECIYALPRAGKAIKGPSVRMAEIVASQWGNCRIGTRVVHVDRIEKYVEAEGVFHDLETNMAVTARVRRRISDKKGKLLTEDMIVVTGNAACSIAKRNAILGGVPKAVWRKAYATVEQVIAGDVKTLSERREKAVKAFAAFGVAPEQLLTALGVAGMDDVNLEHMTTLMGMHAALKSGEATVEEMFAPAPTAIAKPKGLNGALDALAGTGEAVGTTTPKDEAKPAAEAKAEPQAPVERPAATEPLMTDWTQEQCRSYGAGAFAKGMSSKGSVPPQLREDVARKDWVLEGWTAARDGKAAA